MGRTSTFGIMAMAILLTTMAVHGSAARAQSATPTPAVTIASIILVEPMTETPVAIQVGPTAAVPRNSFLRIKGLPAQAKFSDGHAVSAGTWALPISNLTDLKVTVPLATTGRAELQIALVAIDGAVLAEARSTLAITAGTIGTIAQTQPSALPASQLPSSAALGNDATTAAAPTLLKPPSPAAQRATPVAIPVAPAASTMKPEERDRALKLLSRGDGELSGGDVAAARLLYQRAADAGLPEAALAMGTTFDPSELARRGVKGLQGDPTTARKWYTRAQELGAPGAAERIGRLPP